MTSLRREDLTGKLFGKLTIIGPSKKINKTVYWYCKCECGNNTWKIASNLKSGKYKSCGCEQGNKKHGLYLSRARKSWADMKERCYNPNNNRYCYYGKRGIKVCKRWQKFENFYKDMGERPEGYSLERLNCDDDYKPSNCKWIPKEDQSKNVRAKGFTKIGNKYQSRIMLNQKSYYLGLFDTPEEAHQAYLEAKKKSQKVPIQELRSTG